MLTLEYLEDANEIRKQTRRQNEDLQATIEEFMKSGMPAAKVGLFGTNYANVNTARNAMKAAIKNSHRRCEVISRRGVLYLIRLEDDSN